MEHSSKPTLVLEINPQYLVPDTNCFIDHLPGLQYIVESRYFTVVIPLVGKYMKCRDNIEFTGECMEFVY